MPAWRGLSGTSPSSRAVPGSGKHRILEAPGSLRPLLGAVGLSPHKAISPGLAPLRCQQTLPINSAGCRAGNAEPPARPPEGSSRGSWPLASLTAALPCRSKAEMGHTCRGTINLATANITVEDSCNFIISNGGAQTYHLKASSEVERQRWVTALELAKAKAVKMLEESGTEFLDPCTRGEIPVPDSAQGRISVLRVGSQCHTLARFPEPHRWQESQGRSPEQDVSVPRDPSVPGAESQCLTGPRSGSQCPR